MRPIESLFALLLIAALPAAVAAQSVDVAELRATQPFVDGWKFVQDDTLTDEAALASSSAAWTTVSLPHTWNAVDAASTDLPGSYQRGVGWYRLEFAAPAAGARHWLEIGAASLVADVWLNGTKLGSHAGGFTAFRFDVTDTLLAGAQNVLLVKVDNSEPKEPDDRTAIAPLGGDFNVSGGLYRYVTLVSTADDVHFDLADLGSSGIYAASSAISAAAATVTVRTKVANDSAGVADYTVRAAIADAAGQLAAAADEPIRIPAAGNAEAAVELQVASPQLWAGRADPYLYTLVAELVRADGAIADRVVQRVGIREMRFDPNQGFFLNGQPYKLHGVAIHQDFQGKGWAVSAADVDATLALVAEVGANAVRLGHYPFGDYMLDRLDELGLVAWAEAPLGLGVHVDRCTRDDATPLYVSNATLQLREMIRQQYNHASIATWAIGNETSARQLQCEAPYDNVTPVIRTMHETAKAEDSTRPTAYAEFDENIGRPLPFATAGITDILGTNRYYWWYDLAVGEFAPLLAAIHDRYPDQPLGVSEYGAGGALTHHTDDPKGGPPEVRSADEGEVTFQPEEYAAYVHEQAYGVISSTPFLWGSFVWNMFDFGSAHRNEGDVLGVNTKGLVTFDRQARKDPFYFYKANWSSEPLTYIVGRRYTERAYAVADIKVYSNADSIELGVNGTPFGALTADRCALKTCVFENVPLAQGANTIEARGTHADASVSTDSVQWTLATDGVNIAAGRLTTGYSSSRGLRFGSDEFFVGGAAGSIDPGDVDGGTPEVANTDDPQLYKFFRRGAFRYDVPLADGTYAVTLGFIEPGEDTATRDNVFDVSANGAVMLDDVDVLRAAGADRTAIARSFDVTVTGGLLTLDFSPVRGDALVSNIAIAAR